MTLQSNNIGRDHVLTLRMVFTGFLLFLTYIALFGILLFTGLPFGFVLIMGIGMVFFQYFFSDWLVLKTTKAKIDAIAILCQTIDSELLVINSPNIAVNPAIKTRKLRCK